MLHHVSYIICRKNILFGNWQRLNPPPSIVRRGQLMAFLSREHRKSKYCQFSSCRAPDKGNRHKKYTDWRIKFSIVLFIILSWLVPFSLSSQNFIVTREREREGGGYSCQFSFHLGFFLFPWIFQHVQSIKHFKYSLTNSDSE